MKTPRKPKEYWPSWRYGPNGEAEIFKSPYDVPYGWTPRRGQEFVPPERPPILDRAELENQLRAKGVTPLGHWSTRYMKELIDYDLSSAR